MSRFNILALFPAVLAIVGIASRTALAAPGEYRMDLGHDMYLEMSENGKICIHGRERQKPRFWFEQISDHELAYIICPRDGSGKVTGCHTQATQEEDPNCEDQACPYPYKTVSAPVQCLNSNHEFDPIRFSDINTEAIVKTPNAKVTFKWNKYKSRAGHDTLEFFSVKKTKKDSVPFTEWKPIP